MTIPPFGPLDPTGDARGLGVAGFAQSADDPVPIGLNPVLAHLPLPDDARHRDLDPDDGLQVRIDEVGRRIGHFPRVRPRSLEPGGQPRDERA